jgi:hypothetical protein
MLARPVGEFGSAGLSVAGQAVAELLVIEFCWAELPSDQEPDGREHRGRFVGS